MTVLTVLAAAMIAPLLNGSPAGAPPVQRPDVDPGGCRFRDGGTELVCATAVQECPNGAFQSAQECAASVHVEPCPGQISVFAISGGSQRILELSCADFVPPRIKRKCRCDVGLFGWCMSTCRPTGGWAGLQACHGVKIDLVSCIDGA